MVYYKLAISGDKISSDINVFLYGMEAEQYAIKATFIGGSLTEDIAVLKIEDSEIIRNSCAVSAVIGDSEALSVTDKVLAVGQDALRMAKEVPGRVHLCRPAWDGVVKYAGVLSAILRV